MIEETQTYRSFKDKWENNLNLAFQETLNEKSEIHQWIMNRNGFTDKLAFQRYLADKNRILDAGCGNGRVTALLATLAPGTSSVVGADLTAAPVATKNLANYPNVTVFQKNLLENLSDLGKFNFIYCQEVLHHTSDPKKGFMNLVDLLDEKGELAIYVYKKKAPVREFVDDFIREKIARLNYKDAVKSMQSITEFGKQLSTLKVRVRVPELELLEIPAGEYEIQRLFYHFFVKCFWNDELSFDDNVAINYDWYHPSLCSRHTMPEVLSWFDEAKLDVVHQYEDFYGITIRGKRV